MRTPPLTSLKARHSAMPAFAGALAASAYLLGAIVFSVVSNGAVPALASASAELPPRHQGVRVTRARNLDSVESRPPAAETVAEEVPVEVAASDMSAVVIAPEPTGPSAVMAPRLVLVIDDVGLDVDAAQRVLALPVPLTVAILPYADAAAPIAALARQSAHDVLLHMPMEPVGLADPGPNALRLGLSDIDLQARMRWAMAQVPGAIGLNNHMGSRFTADPRAMRVALSAVSHDSPVFLDSLTTANSRGGAVAAGLGLRTLQRDIFLDHELDADAIRARLEEAAQRARENGHAVMIGHPHDLTLDILEAWLASDRATDLEFVTASTLADSLFAAEPGLQASLTE